MKEKTKIFLATSLTPYYRYKIYKGDFIRTSILIVSFIVALILWTTFKKWWCLISSIVLILFSALCSVTIIRSLHSGKRLRQWFTVIESGLFILAIFLTLILPNNELWAYPATFAFITLFAELLFYTCALPIISLSNDADFRGFLKRLGNIFMLCIFLPELIISAGLYVYVSIPTSKTDNPLKQTYSQWKYIHDKLLSFIISEPALIIAAISALISITSVVAATKYSNKRATFHNEWAKNQEKLMESFTVWLRNTLPPVQTTNFQLKLRNKKAIKEHQNDTNRAKETVNNIVNNKGNAQMQHLWNLLQYFEDKLDKKVKEVLSENNLHPLLNNDDDGNKRIRELFDSAIVMFAYKSSKNSGFYSTYAVEARGFSPYENWRKYFGLKHEFLLYNYTILDRIYASYKKETKIC